MVGIPILGFLNNGQGAIRDTKGRKADGAEQGQHRVGRYKLSNTHWINPLFWKRVSIKTAIDPMF